MKGNNSAKDSPAAQPQPSGNSQQVVPKVVGPNVKGNLEEYQLVRRLQSALFGGVYEAKGLSSCRDFAIKVLHKSELTKAQESNSIEFCEVPLSEIRFAELMRGHEHVMEAEEHFEDAYCFYVVFELARGGDLLEALKQKPHGFDEAHAQFLIQQATKGLAFLHKRQVAMQDVSLENMLLHVDDRTGQFQVKICDPGQAVIFTADDAGEEQMVNFRGLVGKSFRPPELHDQQPYVSTKVDSWCLGWSTFYLLTAQPLFMSADPANQDPDWLLFQEGKFQELFNLKQHLCSPNALDFIFRLLQIPPGRRMSITDALNHPWLSDPKICPVLAPKELLPESARKEQRREPEAAAYETPGGGRGPVGTGAKNGITAAASPEGSMPWAAPAGGNTDLPTWAGASAHAQNSVVRVPEQARVRSPPRSPRSNDANAARIPTDRRRQLVPGPRTGYVIATAQQQPRRVAYGRPTAATRTASPVQSTTAMPTAMYRTSSPGQYKYLQQADPSQVQVFRQDGSRPTFLTPRSASRPTGLSMGGVPAAPMPATFKVESGDDPRGRSRAAWAFRSDGTIAGPADGMRMGSGDTVGDAQGRLRAVSPPTITAAVPAPTTMKWVPPAGRTAQSPARANGAIYWQRPASPVVVQQVRAASPGGVGFSWAQAPSTFSPRAGSPVGAVMQRAPSPVGFAWSPEPPSPRTSPRSFSPAPAKALVPRWMATPP